MDKITLWEQEEYQYPLSCGFIPNMRLYIHEDDIVRPCILIAPGGGYCVVSPSEGEIVAKKFYDMGYQAAVITYTTNLLMSTPLNKQPMMDLMRAIRYVRKNEENLKVNQVILCGFSAGAHAVGTVGVHFDEIEDKKYPGISARPDALILSYPVITSGEYAHRDSFNALLGFSPSQEDLNYMSLEKHVSENTPLALSGRLLQMNLYQSRIPIYLRLLYRNIIFLTLYIYSQKVLMVYLLQTRHGLMKNLENLIHLNRH